MRIVSLIASATEIVAALGADGELVGRSHECDHPPHVLQVPQLTRPKFKVAGGSLAIDRAVKSLVEQGLAVYEVDADRLEALQPDVILTQDQCEVCAVSLADVEKAVCQWTGRPAHVVSLRPHTLDDVLGDIVRVGTAIDRAAAARNLVQSIRSRFDAIRAAVGDRPRRSVAFIEWIEPLMSCGHWMPELTEIAGGQSLFGERGGQSPWITHEALAVADPDVVVIAPCGYDIDASLAEYGTLERQTGWRALRAVRAGDIYIADGNAYFNRPGPRLVETAEILASILHGAPGFACHAGVGYVRAPV